MRNKGQGTADDFEHSDSSDEQREKSEIVVFCIDYDGCGQFMFEFDEYRNLCVNSENPIVKAIYEHAEREKVTKIIISVGSNRQDLDTDNLGANMNQNGSCFERYEWLAMHLNKELEVEVIFSPVLNADINNNLPIGTAIKNSRFNWKWDEFKPTIVLTQAHYFAEQYSSDDVIFLFFDDRSSLNAHVHRRKDILIKLNELFYTLDYILPHNVFFLAHQYDPINHTCQGYDKYTNSLGPILPRNFWAEFVSKIIHIYEESDDIGLCLDNFEEKKAALERYNSHFEKFKEQDLSNDVSALSELVVLMSTTELSIQQGLFRPTEYQSSTETSHLLSSRNSRNYDDSTCCCALQ